MIASSVSFDSQAGDFDLRAGLPDGVAEPIAVAVAGLAPGGGGVLLDIGAGTGQIGAHLATAWRARPRGLYVAIDISAPMLSVFRRKLGTEAEVALVRANAATRWPVASGSVDLVFSSRAAHLLPPDALVRETLRVAAPGGALAVFGGVKSDPGSLRAELRREMRRLLAEAGFEPRRAGESRTALADALAARGGEVLPVRTAASWTTVHRAADALAAWRAKPGLGGRAVPPEVQETVLRRLEAWIGERYGSLDVERDATERYELAVIRLPNINERRREGTT
jgi:SAM-dependent methyltransferase